MTRFVFITGGVVSKSGKGVASAALGTLLRAHGCSGRLRKLDPDLNVDPGSTSPHQHGQVVVADDGVETDLDLGHYERFAAVHATKADNVQRRGPDRRAIRLKAHLVRRHKRAWAISPANSSDGDW